MMMPIDADAKGGQYRESTRMQFGTNEGAEKGRRIVGAPRCNGVHVVAVLTGYQQHLKSPPSCYSASRNRCHHLHSFFVSQTIMPETISLYRKWTQEYQSSYISINTMTYSNYNSSLSLITELAI